MSFCRFLLPLFFVISCVKASLSPKVSLELASIESDDSSEDVTLEMIEYQKDYNRVPLLAHDVDLQSDDECENDESILNIYRLLRNGKHSDDDVGGYEEALESEALLSYESIQNMPQHLPDEILNHIFSFLSETERYDATHRLNKMHNERAKDIVKAIMDAGELDLATVNQDWIWRLSQVAIDMRGEYSEEVLDYMSASAGVLRLSKHPRFLKNLAFRRMHITCALAIAPLVSMFVISLSGVMELSDAIESPAKEMLAVFIFMVGSTMLFFSHGIRPQNSLFHRRSVPLSCL